MLFLVPYSPTWWLGSPDLTHTHTHIRAPTREQNNILLLFCCVPFELKITLQSLSYANYQHRDRRGMLFRCQTLDQRWRWMPRKSSPSTIVGTWSTLYSTDMPKTLSESILVIAMLECVDEKSFLKQFRNNNDDRCINRSCLLWLQWRVSIICSASLFDLLLLLQ